MRHHVQQIFVFLVEMRFHHVGQPGLELLSSGDPPTSVSRSAGIRGVSHSAQQKSHNVLRKFTDLCCAALKAVLGYRLAKFALDGEEVLLCNFGAEEGSAGLFPFGLV